MGGCPRSSRVGAVLRTLIGLFVVYFIFQLFVNQEPVAHHGAYVPAVFRTKGHLDPGITNLSAIDGSDYGVNFPMERSSMKRMFTVDYERGTLIRDGHPFRFISGSIHYSRVRPEDWKDRLTKMYAAGLNAISTYVPWNFHEREHGVYTFEGEADLTKFLVMAHRIGLLVILRPGPYICAEWEFGGLPWYIIRQNSSCRIRSSDKVYTEAVERWMGVLLQRVQYLLYHNGGPIIMVQIENEYGSYIECDRQHQMFLVNLFIGHLGKETLLFTTDGDKAKYLSCGKIGGQLATVDFGIRRPDVKTSFETLNVYHPQGPRINSEFYTGWLDLWGGEHASVPTDLIVEKMKEMLDLGASVNMYMFHGGTNFGFTSGAVGNGFSPQPTSYDYDAPISEAGDLTEKYYAIRKLIGEYLPLPNVTLPEPSVKYAYGKVRLKYVSSVSACLATLSGGRPPIMSLYPPTMEDVNQGIGYLLYRHVYTNSVDTASRISLLNVAGIRDLGIVTKNEQNYFLGVVDRNRQIELEVELTAGDALDIFVENQGRANYGKDMNMYSKGLIENVTYGNGPGTILQNWQTHFIDVSRLDSCPPKPDPRMIAPSVYTGVFTANKIGNTFIKLQGWTKGLVLINGFNLGRYWPEVGPQITLYVPWSILKKGRNTITVLEQIHSPCEHPVWDDMCSVDFLDKPILSKTETDNVPAQ